MQAIIMAAGVGSRLRPLTEDTPKCFLEIDGKKIIDYQIDLLKEINVDKIIIVTGYLSKMIEDRFEGDPLIEVVFNPFYKKTNVIGSMWFGKKYLNDSYIYMHGDTIFEQEIFMNLLDTKGDIVLPIDFKKCGEEEMKVKLDNNEIKKISKKIKPNKADGEFIGIAKISKNVLKDLNHYIDDFMYKEEFNHFFEEAIQKIIDSGKYNLNYCKTDDYFWDEIDFIEDYNNVKDFYENNNY